jgi:hypothetical protein
MNKQTGNIELIIRVVFVSLFLLLFSVSKNADSGKPVIINTGRTIEYISENNHVATTVAQIDFKGIDHTLVNCENHIPKSTGPDNLRIFFSNIRAHQLIRDCKERFFNIKPHLAIVQLFHFISSDKKGPALIS